MEPVNGFTGRSFWERESDSPTYHRIGRRLRKEFVK